MRKRFLQISTLVALTLLVILPATITAQRRPAARPASAVPNDLKITYRTTTSGQSNQTTTMLKGTRERSEMKFGMGMDMINITQCDLRRTVQISDGAKKYVITPMDSDNSNAPAAAPSAAMAEPSRRGGVITYSSTAVDTGERKEMFGFQARHIKTSLIMESSPDACTPVKQHMETDGWYIDFSYGLNCEVGRSPMGGPPARGGCRDRVNMVRKGAARTGYALVETVTSYGPDGSVAFSSTKEVVELSRAPLDAALFDIPAGYTEAQSTQELYAGPSMSSMMAQAAKAQAQEDNDQASNSAQNSGAKAAGAIRVGVVQINNKTDRSVSTDSLRERLMNEIQGSGIEAVTLNAISAREAEVEAKAKQCDFILYTDLTALKLSAAKSLGGLLGRATGVGSGSMGKTEAKVEFKLFAVGETSPRLSSAAGGKEEGDEASAGTALSQEAKQVGAEAKRKRG